MYGVHGTAYGIEFDCRRRVRRRRNNGGLCSSSNSWNFFLLTMFAHQTVNEVESADEISFPVDSELIGKKVIRRCEGFDVADGEVMSYDRSDFDDAVKIAILTIINIFVQAHITGSCGPAANKAFGLRAFFARACGHLISRETTSSNVLRTTQQ